MNKFLFFILFLFLAPFIGGIYGIVHDQLTYTLSPEYYTRFKFFQFGLAEGGGEAILGSPRLAVSAVGFMATWWMGLIIGIVLALVGLIHRNGRRMFMINLKASLLTIAVALVIGIIGLLGGFLFLDGVPNGWYAPEGLVDEKNFAAVGSMHNFSYLGGLVGLGVAIFYSIKMKTHDKN